MKWTSSTPALSTTHSQKPPGSDAFPQPEALCGGEGGCEAGAWLRLQTKQTKEHSCRRCNAKALPCFTRIERNFSWNGRMRLERKAICLICVVASCTCQPAKNSLGRTKSPTSRTNTHLRLLTRNNNGTAGVICHRRAVSDELLTFFFFPTSSPSCGNNDITAPY